MMMQVLTPAVEHGDETDLDPECSGSAAMVWSVSAAVRNRMAYTVALFWNAISATGAGTVKTTWKYRNQRRLGLPAARPIGAGRSLALGNAGLRQEL